MIPVFCARKKISVIVVLLLFGVPFFAHADCQVALQWDANNPAPEGYRVFVREDGQAYDYNVFSWQGDFTFQQCTITGLDENTTYYFIVRAFEGDDLSGDSNEVRFNYSDSSLHYGSSRAGSDEAGAGCFIQSLFQW